MLMMIRLFEAYVQEESFEISEKNSTNTRSNNCVFNAIVTLETIRKYNCACTRVEIDRKTARLKNDTHQSYKTEDITCARQKAKLDITRYYQHVSH